MYGTGGQQQQPGTMAPQPHPGQMGMGPLDNSAYTGPYTGGPTQSSPAEMQQYHADMARQKQEYEAINGAGSYDQHMNQPRDFGMGEGSIQPGMGQQNPGGQPTWNPQQQQQAPQPQQNPLAGMFNGRGF